MKHCPALETSLWNKQINISKQDNCMELIGSPSKWREKYLLIIPSFIWAWANAWAVNGIFSLTSKMKLNLLKQGKKLVPSIFSIWNAEGG